jgi:hypothetical protein
MNRSKLALWFGMGTLWSAVMALLLCLCWQISEASESIYAPNLNSILTGTDVGGKKALDVNVTNALTISTSGLATEAKQDATITLLGAPAQEHSTAVSPNACRLSDGTSFYKGTTPSDTQPISAVSLPLPSGAATAANQSTQNTSLSNIDTSTSGLNAKFGSLGQKAMTGSAPVVIASDQSAIPASQNGTWNINNISGTVSLPTGAATAANQTTANTSLSSIDGKLNSLGQKTAANSVPVVIASNQSGVQTVAPLNGNATLVNTTVGTTAATITSPGTVVGFILQAADTNSANMRWRIGGIAATTTVGMQLQPGRDTGVIPYNGNVSIISESGTNEYQITWIQQ